jgi:ABC-2 type transport system ATP-binding protein
MSSPLLEYMENAKRAGLSPAEISSALERSGWKLRDVVQAILAEEREIPVPAPVAATMDRSPVIPKDPVSVSSVSKSFGSVQALSDVSLKVPAGNVLALLGPNGAGKTTLVRIMATLLEPDSGEVFIAGKNLRKDPQSVRAAIGLSGQFAAIDGNLTGRENLELFAQLYHMERDKARQRAQELLEQFELTEAADRPAKTYSGGMGRRLDLAASLLSKPPVLFLDEPTTGLDPHSRIRMWEIITDLVQEGTTVLLTTQYLEEADRLADSIVVIDKGRIIAQGTAEELKTKVGGDVLELHVETHDVAGKAAQLLRQIGHAEPHIDQSMGLISIPVKNGTSVIAEAIRILDNNRIKIADIVLRRPTLDDVFLALTGRSTQ